MASVQDIAITVVDAAMALLPRTAPTREALDRCRLISHRGEHDNHSVMENTLPAFRAARDAGVWGIECDIRWTSDLVPVICHDATPGRVFGEPTPVAQMTCSELRTRVPGIPTLVEVVEEFGGATHLMLEIKQEPRPEPDKQKDILRSTLSSLAPGDDYHLLALEPETFESVDFIPPSYWLPVAELNVSRLSQWALEQGCAGLGGHYLLLNAKLKRLHDAQGQQLGTGFPTSRNCLFRELNRGIEWIFSNDAVKLQKILDHQRRQ